jgi:hypothetical protein
VTPQPDGTSRPRLDWWWDGSDRGEIWAWLLALAGVVVAFSLGVLVTAGSSPIRGIALANLLSGLGVGLLPTLIALRRLDRRRRLSDFGVVGDQEVRRALHRSLVTLGLVDERPPEARPVWPLPPVRPASWYRLLAACWAGFVLLGTIVLWGTARGLFAAPDPAGLAVSFAMVALPVLLAWLVALHKAARVAHWLATRAKAGRTARAARQPVGRRLAAGPRRTAGATVAGWRGLQVGVAAAARRTAGATVAGWRGLEAGVAAGVRWAAGATVAGWHGIQFGLVAAAGWAAAAAAAGWHGLQVGVPPAARRAADATVAGWHRLQLGLAAGTQWATGATVAGWHRLEVSVPPAARRAADATVAGWRGLKSGVAARTGGWSGQPLSRRLADDGRRGAGVTLARWRGLESGSRRYHLGAGRGGRPAGRPRRRRRPRRPTSSTMRGRGGGRR